MKRIFFLIICFQILFSSFVLAGDKCVSVTANFTSNTLTVTTSIEGWPADYIDNINVRIKPEGKDPVESDSGENTTSWSLSYNISNLECGTKIWARGTVKTKRCKKGYYQIFSSSLELKVP